MEIKINLKPSLQVDELYVVRRLARLVCRDDLGIREEERGYKYCLDCRVKLWFASGIEDNQITVFYRDGTKELMNSLKIFAEWIFKF